MFFTKEITGACISFWKKIVEICIHEDHKTWRGSIVELLLYRRLYSFNSYTTQKFFPNIFVPPIISTTMQSDRFLFPLRCFSFDDETKIALLLQGNVLNCSMNSVWLLWRRQISRSLMKHHILFVIKSQSSSTTWISWSSTACSSSL